MRRLLLLVLVLPLFAQDAPDGVFDAYDLKRALLADVRRSTHNSVMDSWSMGYIQGIADALDNDGFCLPRNYAAGELKEVVVKYLNDHPEKLHESRGVVVGVALHNAFPCPQPSTKAQ